jgi:hypothetical protein
MANYRQEAECKCHFLRKKTHHVSWHKGHHDTILAFFSSKKQFSQHFFSVPRLMTTATNDKKQAVQAEVGLSISETAIYSSNSRQGQGL